MKRKFTATLFIYFIVFSFMANSYTLIASNLNLLWVLIPLFIFINIFSGTFIHTKSLRLKICNHGVLLLSVFVISAFISVIYHIVLFVKFSPDNIWQWVFSALLSFALNTIIFWNGILCVYLTSVQLGLKKRVIGALLGMIPIANLFALNSIIKTVTKEVDFEVKKESLNQKRRFQEICKTKYPILLVHGVFFRDTKFFNYWGRIPAELKRNGAEIYYGNHQSASSVESSAEELAQRIEAILKESKADKVNIIAHSKGGLDCRYALSELGICDKVASLTTINTPHNGCMFADYLLTKISETAKNTIANTYNKALNKFGDTSPDFLSAVNNLTASYCKEFNARLKAPENVYCQSVGSVLSVPSGGKFPLNFSHTLVKHFDGENDGLVSAKSFEWGDNYTLLRARCKRGISHGDMIDLNRENLPDFDVREFYVKLVSDLKEKGF